MISAAEMDFETGSEEWYAGYDYAMLSFTSWLTRLIEKDATKVGKMTNPDIERIRDWIVDHK